MKILKYLDFFGIYFHFYIGNKRKLYTSYGGVISIICLFFCICIFFMLTFKDLLHKNPISNLSSVSQAGYHKIKFEKEKLWIPWRIIDSNKKVVNYENILYPKIYIMKGEKNIENRFNFQTHSIKHELCNETAFAKIGDHHYIDASLNELYCVDFNDIELGGGWNADYLNFVKIDIDICKDEIDRKNKNCTNFENFMKNGTWAIEYFYPIVEYQPTNYKNPILVIYKNHFYDFSKYLSKEERIYFQEYILNDDKGLIFNDDLNSSFWGFASSDFDILYSNNDINNESISSKIYSLSIFIDAGKILYVRRYNKIYTIVANVFPIFNAVFFMFDTLSYMIKTIMTEKYLSELFFQRINENDKIELHQDKRKSTNFFNRNYKINLSLSKGDHNNNYFQSIKNQKRSSLFYESIEKKKNKTIISDFSCKSSDGQHESIKKNKKANNNNNNEINCDEINQNEISNISNNKIINKNTKTRKKNNVNINNISKNSSKLTEKSQFENINNKLKDLISNRNVPKINCNNSSNINSSFCPFGSPKRNNYVEVNLKNANKDYKKKDYKNQTINNDITNLELNNKNKMGFEERKLEFDDSSENNDKFNFYKNKGFNNSAIITRFRLKGSLFRMKDYIYSFFVKAVRNRYRFLSDEFAAIFNFLSEIYDISSYLQLYKQFHIISGFLLDNVANININHKININNKDLFEQVRLKNKNVFYFALKEQFNQNSNKQ